ncbi:uncharacterized protein LOC117177159 isoform X2 [Belonocnema kinseyi]|nr:uncharacterized protein LOC117177159 isoform X2 [Belonocnema kinseyi]
MVASTNNLEDLGINHPANASIEIRQQQQQQQGHACKSAVTAQDKRSRLSNVINNLRKKVPEPKSESSSCTKEDVRNSVERNLETLEQYVMTVLNGVIKDQEESNLESNVEKLNDSTRMKDPEDSDEGFVKKGDDSKDCENRLEPSVPASEEAKVISIKGPSANLRGLEEEKKDSNISIADEGAKIEKREEISKEEEEEEIEKRSRTLGTIIMERLTDHQDQKEAPKMVDETFKKFEESSKNLELQRVCKELLNDLLNDIVQSVHQTESADLTKAEESQKIVQKNVSLESLRTSLHCSLPLEKVASVLQTCQVSEGASQTSPKVSNKTSTKATSPTVRHLCLYCDRKFLSISLRQRHTDRVHQLGGGRRSERNSKKSSQSCQYCSDKCVESLEGLFEHMIGNHGDKYHACLQCVTRYLTREALINHTNEAHSTSHDRIAATHETFKEISSVKELPIPSREKAEVSSKEKKVEDDPEFRESSTVPVSNAINKDLCSNPGSPEFESSFYSSVSCNIRENLLHHLDGKIQANSTSPSKSSIVDLKSQSFCEQSTNQMQFPIDISLTAVTPVYNKDYSSEEFANSSEYAQKPRKNCRSHPRRVSFEKYNFPRKYDGKEQWTCSIKDLSKFDISTQLSLRKKQQLIKEGDTLSRLNQVPTLGLSKSDFVQTELNESDEKSSSSSRVVAGVGNTKAGNSSEENPEDSNDVLVGQETESSSSSAPSTSKGNQFECEFSTEFSSEFQSFLRLKKWGDPSQDHLALSNHVVYAELTGEWSRPRIYICGACAAKQETLKEMEDHKAAMHPNVWCSHYEFSGDQLELYKHLFLPGKSSASSKVKNLVLPEKICTKCSKSCSSLAELHKHMLECGGDQAWLLGLFGNGKKKCKWRPFGSRSRRRRNRGMKRNIQNSQTPRINVPKEKQPTGPRVRPSDRESIQKMLANLPPKRATRKVLQESAARSQGRLRKVQAKSRSGLVDTSSTRLSRSKAVLRNKLLKNAKSFQRKRCRNDNISAAIETVVSFHEQKKFSQASNNAHTVGDPSETGRRTRMVRNVKVLSKRKTIKTKESIIRHIEHPKTRALKSKSASPVEASAARSSPRGETSKINDPVITKGKSNIVKSISQSPANGTSAGNSLKKKKTVDPIASLNASMKAKSQLRTNDGKFARSPLKTSKSLPKSDDSIESSKLPQGLKKRGKGSSASGPFLRSKLKVAQHLMKDAVRTSRRNSRLSSDKMPTLEPEIESSVKDDTLEKSSADFPILSPVPSTSQPKDLRSSSRNSSLGRKSEGGKDSTQNKVDICSKEEVIETEDNNKSEEGKRKRLKKTVKKEKEVNDVKEVKEIKEANELMNTKDKDVSEQLAPSVARDVRGQARKSLPAKVAEKKDSSISLRRFSNSCTSNNKEDESDNAESETVLTKRDLSLECKRLSNPNEDLLKNLDLKSAQSPKKNTKSVKSRIGSEDIDPISKAGTKAEKPSVMRKSPRTAEKKNLSLDNKEPENEVADKSTDPPSLDESFKVGSIEDNKLDSEKQKHDEYELESSTKNNSLEVTPSTSQNKTISKRKKRIETLEKEAETLEEEVPKEVDAPTAKEDDIITKIPETTAELVNLSLETIQQESGNSNMDSGKENSLEMSMNVAKLKVTRPKKTRNARKERTSKRSLNNVIGILTEGINIPIEAQESVVLTLQTSLEITNPVSAFQNNGGLLNENNATSEPTETVSRLDSNVVDSSSENPIIEDSKEAEPKTGGSNENVELPKVAETTSKDPPTNDIILDLSRRKPKGKGSFLERIVSKIAKKKDVLLESDAVFSLESANDDLRNVPNNAGPVLTETCSENSEVNQNTDKDQKPQSSVSENNDTEVGEIRGTEMGSESARKSKKRSLEANSPKKNKRKITTEVSEEAEVEKELCFGDIMSLVHKSVVPADDIADEQMVVEKKVCEEKEETDEISLENETSINEKQNIEGNIETSRRSKRHSKNENSQDQELLNIPNSGAKVIAESLKVTRKSSRKSVKQDNIDKLEELASAKEEVQLQNNVTKSEDLPDVQSVIAPSENNSLLNDYVIPEDSEQKVNSGEIDNEINYLSEKVDDQASVIDLKSEVNDVQHVEKKIEKKRPRRKSKKDMSLIDENRVLPESYIEGSDCSLGNKDRQTKNLAEEHLELSDDDSALKSSSEKVSQFSGESDDSESVKSFKRPKNRSSKRIDKDSDSEMFKIPNAFGTNKRSSKRKSLLNENLESTDNFSSEDTSASESSGLVSEESEDNSTKKRYSKRRQIVNTPSESEDDVSTVSFSTTAKSSNEESNMRKRQTPGRKAKQNVSLPDEHVDLPIDKSPMQEEESSDEKVGVAQSATPEKKQLGRKPKKNLIDAIKPDNGVENAESSGISEEEQNISGGVPSISFGKKRAGRKPKKNISLVNQDLISEDTSGTDNEVKDTLEKSVEEKLCEGIQTQLTRSELMFVSNMENKRLGKKSKNSTSLAEEHLLLDDVPMQKVDAGEKIKEKVSLDDRVNVEPLKAEIETTQNVVTEGKRPGKKPKKNIALTDSFTTSDDVSMQKELQVEEETKSNPETKTDSERETTLEVQAPAILKIQSSLTGKKRPGRKAKKNILVDEVSVPYQQKDDIGEENIKELVQSLEVPQIPEVDESNLEKKRPRRKSKKNISLVEEHLSLLDDTILEASIVKPNIIPNLEELVTTEEVEIPENLVDLTQNKSPEKRRTGRNPKNFSTQHFVEKVEEKTVEKLEETLVEPNNLEIEINQTNCEKKRPGRKPRKNIVVEDPTQAAESIIRGENFAEVDKTVAEEFNEKDDAAIILKNAEVPKRESETPERRRPGRKAKKNISLVGEHLSLTDDLPAPNDVPGEIHLVEKTLEETSERKRPGRKSKKNISELAEELEIKNLSELEINLPEQSQASDIEIRSASLERKRSGRKSKKNLSLVNDSVVPKDSVQKLHSGQIDHELDDLCQKDSDHVSGIDSNLQVNDDENTEKIEKKRPRRKSKKDISLLPENLILPDKNASQNKESDQILENEHPLETTNVIAVHNESAEKKRPVRKSKKHTSLFEDHLTGEIPIQNSANDEKTIKAGGQEKTKVTEKESEEVIQSAAEVLVPNTLLERKRPGRKAKKNISLLDEHLDLLDHVETLKEKEQTVEEESVKVNSVVNIKEKISEESKTSVDNTARSESSERKRKTLKRKSKNVSLVDEHLALSDENKAEQREDSNKKPVSSCMISDDVSSTLENVTSILENEVYLKSSLIDEHLDLLDSSKQEEFAKDDIAEIAEDKILEVQEQESDTIASEKEPSVRKEIETSLEPDYQEPSESKESLADDLQTPKKRPAGNFAVVHTKSGEILIVEKKKKLTKEAAKFFCDICATSFTRKSSLKKHNISQSHLIQINHTTGKEHEKEITPRNEEETILDDDEKAEKIDVEVEERIGESLSNNENLEKTEGFPNASSAQSLILSNENLDKYFEEKKSIPEKKIQVALTVPTQPPEENMEDELLDEEICKITENMTHDEYVLTDHISPVFPEAASTPIKNLETKAEITHLETGKKKGKKTRGKKKNLADEHLDLNTPEPNFDTSTESQTSLEDDFVDKSSNLILDISAIEEPVSIALSEIESELNIQKPVQQLEIEATIPEEINVSAEIKTPDTTKVKRKTRKQNTEAEQIVEANTNLENSSKRVSLRFGRSQEKKEDTSRPRRHQNKQNYKEYEALDFEQSELDLENSTSKRETSKSKKSTASSRESSRSKKNQQNENSKKEVVSQNKIENRTRGRPKNDEQNEEKEEIKTFETLTESLTQILGTESESNLTFKIPDGERIQDSLLSSLANDVKSNSKLEDPKAIFGEEDDLKLDFLNVAESLKAQDDQVKFNTNDSVITEFDSDDNSLNTDMSVDIQKLLDDPELSMDNNSSQTVSNNAKVLSKVVESELLNLTEIVAEGSTLIENYEVDKIIEDKTEDAVLEEIENKTNDEIEPEIPRIAERLDEGNGIVDQEIVETSVERQPKTSRSEKGSGKGHKSKSRQKKGSSKNKIVDVIQSEVSDNEYATEAQNKSKIVRSVFGRVFGGEKIDKVKEVLEDWNSKSESSDNELNKSKEADLLKPSRGASKQRKDAKKKRRSRNSSASGSTSRGTTHKVKNEINTPISKTRQEEDQFKTSRIETSLGTSELLITSSRCRQSKKRAEERISTISRVFDESPIPDYDYDDDDDDVDAGISKSQKESKYKEASHEFKTQKYSENSCDFAGALEANQGLVKKDRKKSEKSWEEIFTGSKTDSSRKAAPFDPPLETDFKSNEYLSRLIDRESVTSVESSLRSHSPLSQNSEEDHIEDDILRRRMSPFFDYNNSYTSLGSSTNSNDEAIEEEELGNNESVEEKKEIRRKSCSSEFSGEKIVIRSPLASHENRVEIVTIAPTDAIEDNALDVPQEIITATAAMSSTSQHKSRQGKVLNFDQELFVECCSRLKATTEKELRGAKKIKLDHSETYRKDNPAQIFRSSRDRWRDVESQNSLGSLLESVNQLLGEEMYSNNEKDNEGRENRSERSSRSASPDASRADNLGYEDSLDVAFEHNNKLRDKIQQRMRESENLISNTFGQKSNNSGEFQRNQFMQRDDREESVHVYGRVQNQFSLPNLNNSNGVYGSGSNKGNQSFPGGPLDKALTNLLHNNSKHDHNGSNPMKVLAELACARVPTATAFTKLPPETQDSLLSTTNQKESVIKKPRNPIKELFERKKEIYERKQIEKAKTVFMSRASHSQKSRRTKKTKKKQEFPLIRNDYYDGLAEKKKRHDTFDKRENQDSSKTKDIYDFDDEDSQIEPAIGPVLSYRSKLELSGVKERSVDMSNLMSKTIGDTLGNGKTSGNLSKRLASMVDHKFKDIEKFAPKTKGALKSYQSEDKLVTGPMDGFIERKKSSKRAVQQPSKHPKLKKKGKSAKKKSRNAWYENDSSDEFITAAKAEDVGVGISKSQRTCSKGKQNLFAELSSSSESELVDDEIEEVEEVEKVEGKLHVNPKEGKDVDSETETGDKVSEKTKKKLDIELERPLEEAENEYYNWGRNRIDKFESNSESDSESESELIIDLKKDSDDNKESEDEEPAKEEEEKCDQGKKARDENQSKKEWIPLEEALNLLDQHDNLDGVTKEVKKFTKASRAKSKRTESESSDKLNKESKENHSPVDEQEAQDDDLPILPEKLTTNEKPQKESDNLPLHVFLSRKVQESKKRKQQQERKNKKLQEASISEFEPIRRQRKCAIGKQGLLAEISSSDEEIYSKTNRRKSGERSESERPRKQKKESKEKRKERYIEKKHEQMIAKEQKAIEEEILRELEKSKAGQGSKGPEEREVQKLERDGDKNSKRKHQKQKSHQDEEIEKTDLDSEPKEKKQPKSSQKSKKNSKLEAKGKGKVDKPKSRRNSVSNSKDLLERRLSSGKRDSGDELRTTKSWNKVDEAVGVAIGRRKRAAVNQLYYWSSSSDEEEKIEAAPDIEEEDDRVEQHGWIVGDSHKKMITMLAMEKQLKEKRRRSEDEFESGKGKNKKHRNSTS